MKTGSISLVILMVLIIIISIVITTFIYFPLTDSSTGTTKSNSNTIIIEKSKSSTTINFYKPENWLQSWIDPENFYNGIYLSNFYPENAFTIENTKNSFRFNTNLIETQHISYWVTERSITTEKQLYGEELFTEFTRGAKSAYADETLFLYPGNSIPDILEEGEISEFPYNEMYIEYESSDQGIKGLFKMVLYIEELTGDNKELLMIIQYRAKPEYYDESIKDELIKLKAFVLG